MKGGHYMPQFVTAGTTMTCTMGATPASLIVAAPIVSATTPVATIADTIPDTNIPTFGLCMSPGNPQVAAATAAAQGVLTPQPCVPATGTPWAAGSVICSDRRPPVRAHYVDMPVHVGRDDLRGRPRTATWYGDIKLLA